MMASITNAAAVVRLLFTAWLGWIMEETGEGENPGN